MKELYNKIEKSDANIGIIGLGYVGLPLCVRFVEKKFNTIGFDIDEKKVDMLNKGKSYINHISNQSIILSLKNKFQATSDFRKIEDVDIIIICVPTPLKLNNEPDLSYITKTLDLIEPYLICGQLLILESTTYPGTTDELIVPFLEKQLIKRNNFKRDKNLKVGTNFFVGYSPEREDPGNKNFSTKNIPKIVSGFSPSCLKLTEKLYDQVVKTTVPVSSTKTAEMTKILENIHRSVNIGLVNELKLVAEKMNINIYEVINAASTKPFGFTPYYPGPGLGGHCIPIDPFYLSWKAKQVGVKTEFIELAGKVNSYMPTHIVNKTINILKNHNLRIDKSKIIVLGISYKKNIDDTRESPSFPIIEKLLNKGAKVDYSDPYFDTMPKTRKYDFQLENVVLNPSKIQSYDLVLLSTDHDSFDYKMILDNAKIIVDTRGKFNISETVYYA